MSKKRFFLGFFLLIFFGIATFIVIRHKDQIREYFRPSLHPLSLSGNIDDRQVNLAFMIPERIAEINVEEGDVVRKGDLLGTLETIRIENRITEAEAIVATTKAAFDKATNGFRQEEIAMAEAGVNIVKAQIKAAENEYKRNQELENNNKAVSTQEMERAEANYHKLLAELDLTQNNLTKMMSGSREEDIAAAQSQWDQAKAALKIQQQILADTRLYAPCDGIVRNRIQEPGEMASPQTTALILAVVTPKWVRVYLSEMLLPKVKTGEKTLIHLDGMEETLDGWVGYISPNAEFTPKNVETKELRPSLVYEVRVYVNDPDNLLKLGAPATVSFPEIMVP